MLSEKKTKCYFRITYKDQVEGKILVLKARKIFDSTLGISFIAISDFLFDNLGVVVDPAEEALAKKFQGIQKIHLSIYSIVSIEEVGEDHEGLRFKNDKANLVVLPNNPTSSH